MENEFIKIPRPDFSFSEIVRRKAVNTTFDLLNFGYYMNIIAGRSDNLDKKLKGTIFKELNELYDKEGKLEYISILLVHLSHQKTEMLRMPHLSGYIEGLSDYLNEIQYELYNRAKALGFNFDRNSFTDEEVNELDRKINAILIKLDEIQVANEVIFNEVEDLKNKFAEDFESLKSDYPLGKKRWHQRLLGISVNYVGEKGADAILEQLKPSLHDFFVNQVPHIIDKL